MDPASNAAASESRDTVVLLSLDSSTSSPVHCSPDGQTLSSTRPVSPVFSTPLVAESSSSANHHHRSPPPAQHSPSPTEDCRQSVLFSPPTDMDTDVSAIIGQAAEESELWKSDISFEVDLHYTKCIGFCFNSSHSSMFT